jgi:hypothetical protein
MLLLGWIAALGLSGTRMRCTGSPTPELERFGAACHGCRVETSVHLFSAYLDLCAADNSAGRCCGAAAAAQSSRAAACWQTWASRFTEGSDSLAASTGCR